MAPGRASLKEFLATAKKTLQVPHAQRLGRLTFVVGNESADLDSLCSTLLYAYFRTHAPAYTLPPPSFHIPLSNLPRADLALRPELTAVLTPAGLRPDDLITLTDLPSDGEHALRPQDTRWILVDHNVLTGDLARFAPQVVGCIDHHDDEGAVPHNLPPDEPRVFAKCGSCMSLVLDRCHGAWDALTTGDSTLATCDDGTPAVACDAALARIALAPVLIDTTSLTSKDKTTDWDVRAVELAEAKLTAASSSLSSSSTSPSGPPGSVSLSLAAAAYDRGAYYDDLTRLKEQIDGLSYRDVLRRDYKRWGEGALAVGVSTVQQQLGYVMQEVDGEERGSTEQSGEGQTKGKEAFLDALRAWAAEQKLDVAAVMTVSRPEGVFTRELLVWGLSREGVKVLGEFARRYLDELGLETWEGGKLDGGAEGEAEWRVCWRQTRVEHSRKQVAPMLREAMRASAKL